VNGWREGYEEMKGGGGGRHLGGSLLPSQREPAAVEARKKTFESKHLSYSFSRREEYTSSHYYQSNPMVTQKLKSCSLSTTSRPNSAPKFKKPTTRSAAGRGTHPPCSLLSQARLSPISASIDDSDDEVGEDDLAWFWQASPVVTKPSKITSPTIGNQPNSKISQTPEENTATLKNVPKSVDTKKTKAKAKAKGPAKGLIVARSFQ
jgi:hypothetical protein